MTLSVRPIGPWTCGVCGGRGLGYESFRDHVCPLQAQRIVVGEFEAEYGVRAPGVPSPHSLSVPGRMTFTVLEKSAK